MGAFTPDGQLSVVWPMRSGATFTKRYQWKTGPKGLEGAVPLSTWTARCQFRDKVGGAIMLDLTNGQGITLDDDGNIDILITAAQVTAMAPHKKALFDLELTSASGFVRNLVGGYCTFAPNITVGP